MSVLSADTSGGGVLCEGSGGARAGGGRYLSVSLWWSLGEEGVACFPLSPCSKAGMSTTIKAMSAEMDKGVYSFDEDEDIHIIGSLLKKFLKELPDAVIPANMYEDFVACARDGEEQHRLERLKDLVYALPTAHYHTLKYLLVHLQKVTAHCEENKVSGWGQDMCVCSGLSLAFCWKVL